MNVSNQACSNSSNDTIQLSLKANHNASSRRQEQQTPVNAAPHSHPAPKKLYIQLFEEDLALPNSQASQFTLLHRKLCAASTVSHKFPADQLHSRNLSSTPLHAKAAEDSKVFPFKISANKSTSRISTRPKSALSLSKLEGTQSATLVSSSTLKNQRMAPNSNPRFSHKKAGSDLSQLKQNLLDQFSGQGQAHRGGGDHLQPQQTGLQQQIKQRLQGDNQ